MAIERGGLYFMFLAPLCEVSGSATGSTSPPPHVKNSHKIDGHLARWLICLYFMFLGPPLRSFWVRYCRPQCQSSLHLLPSHRAHCTGWGGGNYFITIFDNHYNFHHSFQLNKQDFYFVTDFLKWTCQDHCYDCFKLTCLFWSLSVLYLCTMLLT